MIKEVFKEFWGKVASHIVPLLMTEWCLFRHCCHKRQQCWSNSRLSKQLSNALQHAVQPPKLLLPLERSEPLSSLAHGSLHAPESASQTASLSVQPFLQGSWILPTDRPRYYTCNNRLHDSASYAFSACDVT